MHKVIILIKYNNNSFYLAYLICTLLVLLFLFPANSQELDNKTDNSAIIRLDVKLILIP